MDKNNILIGAIAGAAVGAIVGSCLTEGKGRQFVQSATEGLKDAGRRVSEYARQNVPGMSEQTDQISYHQE